MKQGLIAVLLFVMSLGFVRAEEQDPRTRVASLRTQLAANYYTRGQYGVALEELKNALQAKPDYAMAYNVQGLVYTDLKELDSADKSFRRALDIDANDPDINHNYGWFLCNKRDRAAESLRYFAAALKNALYERPERSLQQGGLCAIKVGDLKQAEDYLRKADRTQPDNADTLLGLAQLAYARGEFESTRVLLARQARLGTPEAVALWLNIRNEHRLGNSEAEA
ncbi:type IV pilus biogenesis/stability protein PilW, partial [Chitinimonas sp.]|uniref:type IV pilus biogenesis/stability protein PilW n=1 Tax=Chitinimonas sp. TaxID=1934313 RepID=UPI002F95D7DF